MNHPDTTAHTKHIEASENNSAKLLKAITAERLTGDGGGGYNLRWTETFSGVNWGNADPNGKLAIDMRHRVALIQATAAAADKLRTGRDACPMCGVRSDIGCQHMLAKGRGG